MPSHVADVSWRIGADEDFAKGRYSRGHTIRFDGGAEVAGSASPHVVGKWAAESAVDPEEMLVAALSSCHMMSFLHVARLAGFTVGGYQDQAEGWLEAIAPGRYAVGRVVLHPKIQWIGESPDQATLDRLHHDAHEACYIANSVKTAVTIATVGNSAA